MQPLVLKRILPITTMNHRFKVCILKILTEIDSTLKHVQAFKQFLITIHIFSFYFCSEDVLDIVRDI